MYIIIEDTLKKLEQIIKAEIDEIIETKTSLLKKIFSVFLVVAFIAGGIFFVWAYKKGEFNNLDSFQDYINSFGAFGPLILCIFQCFKVIYAFIPGTLGYIVGPTLFGTLWGIVANYIGICLGSFIVFGLARKYGMGIMHQIFSQKKYDKYMNWMKAKTGKFGVVLWFLLLIPFSPDDFLCYFSGLTDMSFKKFALIILTVKPWLIIIYSLIFGTVFN